MSAQDSDPRQQAAAVARGSNCMALRLAERIDNGSLRSPVAYAPGCKLTIAQIRSAGLKELKMLLKTARNEKPLGKANGGSHMRAGRDAFKNLTSGLVQWSGFKPSLRIDWKDIDLKPAEYRELAVHYELEDKSPTKEVLQALPAA